MNVRYVALHASRARKHRSGSVLLFLPALLALLLGACTSGRVLTPTVTLARPVAPLATTELAAGSTRASTDASTATMGATPTLAGAGSMTVQPRKGSPSPRSTSTPAATGLFIPTPLPADRMPVVHFTALPPQAQDVIHLIQRGGPFRYRQDGITFENREGLLPRQPGGYYHEYTVETPGSSDRGPRRLVRGGQGELYYTGDHYASFKRVVP